MWISQPAPLNPLPSATSMTKSNLSCTISSSDYSARLGMKISLNDQCIFDSDCIDQPRDIFYEFSDEPGNYQLTFEMHGKDYSHTKLDSNGKILQDACLIIDNVKLDGIELRSIFSDQAEYHHNFNGTQSATVTKFYDHMGCNGRVILKFTAPVYLWLLEHM